MDERRKATAWCGRLLLFAALLLGIVTMHTLGHPSEHGSGPPGPTAAQPAAHAMPAHAAHARADDGTTATATGPAAGTPRTDPPPHSGMDPMAVCLAVLAAGWAVALLLGLAALRRRSGTLTPAARARLLRTLWPIPPPRHKALARLSVLRV
ncbi:hypothetical protein [Streptomyces netropsis]|uniref:Uncharacterized protein n=1 Tax=Streptomyces netropsis TaxID=55404 RepID=A0A7W7PBI3_STRNE|nr:hypothetical protein [Streptomyces netropsis]MBB4884601.1 hypothetical protein [Streptomyces netropsis]GGR02557.1 hypothetical protein GCM10010219_03080 [Streptomyces netropsis]